MKLVFWLWVILTIALIALATDRLHGTTTPNRANSLGVSETYLNPYTYMLGLPIAGQVIDEKFTNIRFLPFGTPQIYDESILFCGDVTELFDGKRGVLAVAYETRAHAMYHAVACHELLGVFEVPAK